MHLIRHGSALGFCKKLLDERLAFYDIFLYAVIVPVMPYTLTEKTGINPHDVQHWNSVLIAVYGASLLAFSPICGWFADHTTTRRLPLLLGLVALAGSTVMLNIGTSIGILIAGRLLQGASAAVVWVVGLALLVDTVGQTDVGQSMGYVSMAMSLAILIAPLLGGVVLDHGGYNAVFAMAYAIIGLDIILRLVLVEKKVARRWEPPEEVADLGASSGGAGYGATTSERPATPAYPTDGCDDEEKKSSDITAAPHQTHTSDPEKALPANNTNNGSTPFTTPAPSLTPHPSSRYRLPPTLSLLTSRRLITSLWATLTISILTSALDAVLPLFVRTTFAWSSTGAGLIFLPLVLPSFLAPLFGALADRGHLSPRYPTALGFLAACPCWVLLRFVDHNSLGQKAVLCVLLSGMGVCMAAVMPCIMAEITNAWECNTCEAMTTQRQHLHFVEGASVVLTSPLALSSVTAGIES
ncbi:Major facilitator superfamily [Macrophomina phaseolina MS6]|uniref:Major facilitator superfamily n=1 Tax=Macrophomina phaseolina (strain MS6) TaxID=1126212 RepID=K2S0Q0_MACPH|nr:Major facilitator superfamily [Macrophomina phaseolina MS6]